MSEQVRRRLEKIVKDCDNISRRAEVSQVIDEYTKAIDTIRDILLDEKK